MRHVGMIILALILISIAYYAGMRNGQYLSENTVKQSSKEIDTATVTKTHSNEDNVYHITSQTGILDILIARKLGKKIMLGDEEIKFPSKKEMERMQKIKYFDMNDPKNQLDMSGLNQAMAASMAELNDNGEDLDQLEAEGDLQNARLEMESGEEE